MTAVRKKVLITGGAGLIGSVLVDKLGGGYEISSFDRRKADKVRSFAGGVDRFGGANQSLRRAGFCGAPCRRPERVRELGNPTKRTILKEHIISSKRQEGAV